MNKLTSYCGLYYAYLDYFPSCTPILNPEHDNYEEKLIHTLKRCKKNIESKTSLWNENNGLEGPKYEHRVKINVLIYDYLRQVHDSLITC